MILKKYASNNLETNILIKNKRKINEFYINNA